MKKLCLLFLLISCQNKKEIIVNAEIAIKKEMTIKQDSLSHVFDATDTTGTFSRALQLNNEVAALNVKYDSIETELKKY
jgi:hypothetical protein